MLKDTVDLSTIVWHETQKTEVKWRLITVWKKTGGDNVDFWLVGTVGRKEIMEQIDGEIVVKLITSCVEYFLKF